MKQHEDLYRRTCSLLIEDVAKRRFTPQTVPKLINDLRAELEQCLTLNLISELFHDQMNAKLDRLLRSIV